MVPPIKFRTLFLHAFVVILCATVVSLGERISPSTRSKPQNSQSRVSVLKARSKSDFTKLIARLRMQGAKVERDEGVSQPFFSVKARVLLVNSEGVQVFEFRTAASARAEARKVSPTGTTIGMSKPSWMGPPHFYLSGKLIVLYVGDDAQVKSLLESVLGPQFAGG